MRDDDAVGSHGVFVQAFHPHLQRERVSQIAPSVRSRAASPDARGRNRMREPESNGSAPQKSIAHQSLRKVPLLPIGTLSNGEDAGN